MRTIQLNIPHETDLKDCHFSFADFRFQLAIKKQIMYV